MASSYFAPLGSSVNYPMDSTFFEILIDNGMSDFCATMTAYSMSDVVQERHLPNRCHSQYYNFKSCRANILDDTVTLVFKTKDVRRSIASNKIIKVKVFNDDHQSEIIHWGAEKQKVTRIDGTIDESRSPMSRIVKSKLKLNQRTYELGDTIIGEIKVISSFKRGRRKIKVHEITTGKFRAIVGGFNLDCIQKKVLASSWLRN